MTDLIWICIRKPAIILLPYDKGLDIKNFMQEDGHSINERFRGYFPVVVDIETAGFNAQTDALLEIAAVTLKMNLEGFLSIDKTIHFHIEPFEGANLERSALEFNGIDPHCALRGAVSEEHGIKEMFKEIKKLQKEVDCQRTVMVAHNAAFDMSFLNAATQRLKLKRSPFHPFVSFDTTSLSALAYGQTVLVKACQEAGIAFDQEEAHSALYDAEKTAQLFCKIVNRFRHLGGWPLD